MQFLGQNLAVCAHLVGHDGPDLAVERPAAGGAGVLASLVALLAQDVAGHALFEEEIKGLYKPNNGSQPRMVTTGHM